MEKQVLQTNNAPQAIGPYSQAIKVGSMIYISGQLPINPKSGELIKGNIQEETKQVLENIKAILNNSGINFENIIKTTIFIKNMNDFGLINETYGQYFKNNPPARACVQVSKLPKNANIEIEAIAYLE